MVVLDISDITYYHNTLAVDQASQYFGEGGRRLYTFSREGNRWILTDAKLDPAGGEPPYIEPSIEPFENGSSRVLAKPLKEITEIPEELKSLDKAATTKIMNKWIIDEKEVEAIKKEMGERII